MTALALTLLVFISLSAKAGVKFIVWATYYIPVQDPDVREVSLPDVFIKWAQRSPDSFNSEKWYPGPEPDRKHTEGDLTWNWNTLEMPPEEKPNPSDIDFFQYKEVIKSLYLQNPEKFQVRITWEDKTVVAPVNISKDSLGPWNYQDNYWEDPNYPEPANKRRLHASLKRGIPAAQAAKDIGYLGGRDEAGRIITSEQGAGIDLSKSLADELGFTQKGLEQVEVEFLWVEDEPPPPPFPGITDWPFIQRDPHHTGNNPYATKIEKPMLGKDPLVLIPNVHNFTQPVVSEGVVCLCGDDGIVYAFDAESGVERWRYDTKGTTIVSPAISQSTVYVVSYSYTEQCFRLLALVLQTGELEWICKTGVCTTIVSTHTAPVVRDGIICFNAGWMICAVNQNGALMWQKDVWASYASPVITDKFVFFNDYSQKLYCFDKNNGSLLKQQGFYAYPWHPGDPLPMPLVFSPASVYTDKNFFPE